MQLFCSIILFKTKISGNVIYSFVSSRCFILFLPVPSLLPVAADFLQFQEQMFTCMG